MIMKASCLLALVAGSTHAFQGNNLSMKRASALSESVDAFEQIGIDINDYGDDLPAELAMAQPTSVKEIPYANGIPSFVMKEQINRADCWETWMPADPKSAWNAYAAAKAKDIEDQRRIKETPTHWVPFVGDTFGHATIMKSGDEPKVEKPKKKKTYVKLLNGEPKTVYPEFISGDAP